MTERLRFRRLFLRLPSWLRDGDGGLVLYSLGIMLDAFADRFREATLARFPQSTETNEALEYLGRDRGIIRGRAEPDERYASRLVEWIFPEGHRVRGNAWGMLGQLRAYFLDTTDTLVVDRRGNYYALSAEGEKLYGLEAEFHGGDLQAVTNWSRFWVYLIRPEGWTRDSAYTIGDPLLWDGEIGNSEYVIGLGGEATQSDLQAIRTIVKQWKMAGSQPEYMLVSFDTGISFTPSDIEDNLSLVEADWYDWSANTVGLINAIRIFL